MRKRSKKLDHDHQAGTQAGTQRVEQHGDHDTGRRAGTRGEVVAREQDEHGGIKWGSCCSTRWVPAWVPAWVPVWVPGWVPAWWSWSSFLDLLRMSVS